MGTTNPLYKLDVIGAIRFGSSSQWAVNGNGAISAWDGALQMGWSDTNTNGNYIKWAGGSSDSIDIGSKNTGAVLFNEVSSGVSGNNQFARFYGYSSKTGGTGKTFGSLQVADNGPNLFSSFNISGMNSNIPVVLQPSGGNVGIGTSTPFAKLTVQGAGLSATSTLFDISTTTSKSLFTVLANGNVGVGTTTPAAPLHVPNELSAIFGIGTGNAGIAFGWADGTKYNRIRSAGGDNTNIIFDILNPATHYLAINGDFQALQGVTVGYAAGTVTPPSTGMTVAGNVGIGSTTPFAKLTVQGAGLSATSTLFDISTTTSKSLFTVLANGNVGVGVASPQQKLDVAGDVLIGSGQTFPIIQFGGTSSSFPALKRSNALLRLITADDSLYVPLQSGSLWSQGNIGLTPTGIFGWSTSADSSTAKDAAFSRLSANKIALGNGTLGDYSGTMILGNIGIGTTTPSSKFSLLQSGEVTSFTIGNGASTTVYGAYSPTFSVRGNGNVGIGTDVPGSRLEIYNASPASAGYNEILRLSNGFSVTGDNEPTIKFDNGLDTSNWTIGGKVAGAVQYFRIMSGVGTSSIERLRITSTGRIGIGTTSPVSMFAITGTTTQDLLTVASSSGAVLFNVLSNGNIGIGTQSPSASLEVAGDFGNTNVNAFKLNNNNILNPQAYTFSFSGISNKQLAINSSGSSAAAFSFGSTMFVEMGSSKNVGIGTSTPSTSLFVQGASGVNPLTIASSSGTSLFTVLSNGNVGIGTTSPISTLDVNGNVAFGTGNRATTGVVRLSNNAEVSWLKAGGSNSMDLKVDPSDSFLMVNNGVTRFTLDANGALNVGSNISSGGNMYVPSGGLVGFNTNNGAIFTSSDITFKSQGVTGLYLSGGNVSIGTTSPLAKLDVWGNLNVATGSIPALFVNTATGRVAIGTSTPTSSLFVQGTSGTNPLTVASSSGESLFTVLANGDVGIGTSTPFDLLTIQNTGSGNKYMRIVNAEPGAGTLRVGAAFGSPGIAAVENGKNLVLSAGSFGGTVGFITGPPGGSFRQVATFYSSTTESGLSLSPNGGIVDSNAASTMTIQASDKISVSNTIGNSLLIRAGNSTGDAQGGSIMFSTSLVGSSGSVQNSFAERMRVTSTGNIGIATSSPLYLLHVGNASTSGVVSRFENSSGYCDINPTTTSLTCTSDERLKRNINSLSASSSVEIISRLQGLRPVTYNWNTESSTSSPHAGFIAQEVRPLFPDLVGEDQSGLLSVSYSGFVPYIVEGMKGMIKMIDGITAKVNALSSRVETRELCVGTTCLNEVQLQEVLRTISNGQGQVQPVDIPPVGSTTQSVTPPVETVIPPAESQEVSTITETEI